MSNRVKVVALKRLHRTNPGEVMEVKERDAKFLIHAGLVKPYDAATKASDEKPPAAPVPVGAPIIETAVESDETPVSKEPDATDTATESEDPPKAHPKAPATRRYQTRELKAKE